MARKQWSDQDKARFAEEREQRLVELQNQLEHGLSEMMTATGWTAWLRIATRFHTYSFRNQVLICQQHPEATQVAGYRAWQAAGRQVRRGERSITVVAPVTKPVVDADGQPELDEKGNKRRRISGFKPSPVFDISQTDGPDLPVRPQTLAIELEGDAPPGMWDSLAGYVAAQGFQLMSSTELGRVDGVTRWAPPEVLIREGLSPAHAATVLAHEAGHVSLHDPGAGKSLPCRGVTEVEAESFAYVVAAHHGLDTAPTSFEYLAGWATAAAKKAGCSPEQIMADTAERIRTAVGVYLDSAEQNTSPHPATSYTRAVRAQLHVEATAPSLERSLIHRPEHRRTTARTRPAIAPGQGSM